MDAKNAAHQDAPLSIDDSQPADDGIGQPLRLRLACPQCGGSGMVAWENLDHLFHCRRCAQWYRLDKSRLLPVPPPPKVFDLQVRSGLSEWRDERYEGVHPSAAVRAWLRQLRKSKRPAYWTGLLLAAASVLAVLLRTPGETALCPTAKPLPDALEERVPLWFDAWFVRDEGQMLQLTAPSYDRQLRRWLSRNPAPNQRDHTTAKCQVRLTSVVPRGNQLGEITAEVEFVDQHGLSVRLPFKQTWSCISARGVSFHNYRSRA